MSTLTDILDVLGVESDERSQILKDIGGEPVLIALALEERFNIDIPDAALTAWKTVGDVVDCVMSLVPFPLLDIGPGKVITIPLSCPRPSTESIASAGMPTKTINRITREDIEKFSNDCKYGDYTPIPNALDEYQKIATKSAIYPGQGTPLGLAYVALKLNGEAGEFAEHVGKAMRDDALLAVQEHTRNSSSGIKRWFEATARPLEDARRTLLIKEIGDVLWYLSAACNELGISLSEAAVTNLEKLLDRIERDALRGSGDER